MKYFVIVIIIFILVPLGIWMQIDAKKQAKRHFEEFNLADIDAQIKSVSTEFKGAGIQLVDGREFVFYPQTDKHLNDSEIFTLVAQKGDRVKKAAFSDTLYLLKGSKQLAYKFKKFKN